MMPYRPFQAAAVRARYDIDVLRSRFGVSFEQAANRLTTLQRPGRAGRAVLHAGGRRCRQPLPPGRRAGLSAQPLRRRLSRSCPPCRLRPAGPDPRRSGRDAGRRRVPLRSPARWKGRRARFGERPRRTALLLGCDIGLRGRDRLWRGAPVAANVGTRHARHRSGPPAGSASGRAALPAPSRRSRVRSASTRW